MNAVTILSRHIVAIAVRGRRLVGTALLGLALVAAPACTTNPATGQRQFDLLSTEREIALGEEAMPEFIEEYGGELPSDRVVQYVRGIGRELAAQSERPNLPWEFHVVDSATVNAFALPGGKIFLTRGLMTRMENEAQLAGVLGHEIGHVTAEHIDQQMGRQVALNLGLTALGAATDQGDSDWLQGLGVGAQVGGTLYLLSFSRSQEHQADELGLRYMARVGYNPIGQVQAMRILQRHAAQRGQPIEFLSTHPHPESRIDRLELLIVDRYPDHGDPARYRLGRDEYQSTVLETLEQLPPPEHDPEAQQKQAQR